MNRIFIFILISVFMYSNLAFSEEIRAARGMSLEERMPHLHKGHKVIDSVYALDQLKLNKGAASKLLWSDDYWPILDGGIGYRYKDRNAPSFDRPEGAQSRDPNFWRTVHGYYNSNPARELIKQGRVNQLSPAEKYDLLVGNWDFPLMKNELGRLHEKNTRLVWNL